MGIGSRIGRPWRAALLLAAGAAGGGAALAVAGVPDSGGVIHSCVLPGTGPNLQVLTAGQSCSTPAGAPASALDFNQTGPQGPAGPQGATGPAGPPGRSTTAVSGQTLTLAGGQVITVGGNATGVPQLIPPPARPSGKSLTLTIDNQTVPLLSYSQLAVHGSSGGGGSSARGRSVTVHDIQITRKLDQASPLLSKACVSGQHFKTVTITARKGTVKYLTIKLTTVYVSSYTLSGAGGGNVLPNETFTLSASGETLEYKA